MHENFYHKLKVYYEDTDAGGVVYFANYLKFLERGRTAALIKVGLSNSLPLSVDTKEDLIEVSKKMDYL